MSAVFFREIFNFLCSFAERFDHTEDRNEGVGFLTNYNEKLEFHLIREGTPLYLNVLKNPKKRSQVEENLNALTPLAIKEMTENNWIETFDIEVVQ